MSTTLATEESWLGQIATSKILGICLLDHEGRLIQRLDDDTLLREAILEYQRERIRQLTLSGQSNGRPRVTYPNQDQ